MFILKIRPIGKFNVLNYRKYYVLKPIVFILFNTNQGKLRFRKKKVIIIQLLVKNK